MELVSFGGEGGKGLKDRCERTQYIKHAGTCRETTEDIVKANLALLLRGAEASAEQRAETFFFADRTVWQRCSQASPRRGIDVKKTPLVGRTEVSEDV